MSARVDGVKECDSPAARCLTVALSGIGDSGQIAAMWLARCLAMRALCDAPEAMVVLGECIHVDFVQ